MKLAKCLLKKKKKNKQALDFILGGSYWLNIKLGTNNFSTIFFLSFFNAGKNSMDKYYQMLTFPADVVLENGRKKVWRGELFSSKRVDQETCCGILLHGDNGALSKWVSTLQPGRQVLLIVSHRVKSDRREGDCGVILDDNGSLLLEMAMLC